MQKAKLTKGFTLLEILVVIGIIGVLAGIFAPSLISSIQRARLAEAQTAVTAALNGARSVAQRSSTNQPVTWTTTALSTGARSLTLPNGATFAPTTPPATTVPPTPPPTLPYTYKAPYGELSDPNGFRLEIVDVSGKWHTAVDAMGVTGKVIRRAVVGIAAPIR